MYSNKLIVDILNYINNNLYKQITINELSDLFNYNKDYIMRTFKKEINMTIIQYINSKRIYLSLDGVKSNMSILRVSLDCGFSSQEYFCEIFHSIIGVSPSKYKKFSKLGNNVSNDEYLLITKNIIDLNYKFNKIDEYIKNVPVDSTPRVLSIFKEKTPF